MKARWFTFPLCVAVGLACSPADETGRQESEWVIVPNGTADRATVTLKLPSGFEPGHEWRFFVNDSSMGDQSLAPDVPVALTTTPKTFKAVSRDLGTLILARDVRPTVGFDTQLTFGTLNVYHSFQYRGDKDAFTYDPSARLHVAAPLALMTVEVPGESAPYGITGNWLVGNRDIPLPAGAGKVHVQRVESYDLDERLPVEDTPFEVVLGKRTLVQPVLTVVPPFKFTVHQDDAATMTSVSPERISIACGTPTGELARAESLLVAGGTTIFTGSKPRDCAIYTSDVAHLGDRQTFTAKPGGVADFAMHRIEVADVILTDETPPRTVTGTFSVSKLLPDEQRWSIRLAPNHGSSTNLFDTKTGIVVLSGTYEVIVRYPNAAGVQKTLQYQSTL